jgi:predicted HTH transcriptional regulator
VHADHRGQGGVVIERYPDRIELSNPGSLLVSRVQLLQGGVSECRNKSLQLMFQLMGGGDKAGSGMDKIRAGWRAQHWRSPRLEESLQPDRVKLVLPMVSLIPDEVDQALRVRFGDRFAKLDKTAVQAVVTAQVEGSVTNSRMQEITGEHSKDITGVLQSLGARWSADAAKSAALGQLPRGGGLPPIRRRLPSFGGVLPPKLPTSEWRLPSFDGELPSFSPGTPVIGRTSPTQRQAASG